MPDAPTHVRWRILALLMAYAGLCHFNRISISVAGTEHIMKEHLIDETRMGMVYSTYLFVYTLCMVPGGWLIDRFGPKKSLMLLGFASAVLVPATGMSSYAAPARILLVLCVIRGLLGIVSAPMHPAAARAISFWIPWQKRGAANGLVTGSAVAGIASTYFVFGFLMDLVGWPTAFGIAGVVTLILATVWALYATDHPWQHPGADMAERNLLAADERTLSRLVSDRTSAAGPTGSIMSLFTSRSLVLLTISYATASYFQYLFFYWSQYYFDEVLKLGKDDGRLYATIPTVAMAFGMMSGGWMADQIQSRFGGRHARAMTPIFGMVASALLLVVGILGSQPVWVVTCFALAMAALGASESSFWVMGIELGRERGGLSGAFLNAGGNAGGILAPVLTPYFSRYFGWQAGLGLASALCLVGATLWWWIETEDERAQPDPAIRATRDDAPAASPHLA